MRKCQIYDENRASHAIFELFNFLIFAVHFGRPPDKIPVYVTSYDSFKTTKAGSHAVPMDIKLM